MYQTNMAARRRKSLPSDTLFYFFSVRK